MTGRRARPRAGLVATVALSLLVAGSALVWLLPRGVSPAWREVAFRRYVHARETFAPFAPPAVRPPVTLPVAPEAPPRRAARVTDPVPAGAPDPAGLREPAPPADPLTLVPRAAFRLAKERVDEPLRRPLALPPDAKPPAPPGTAAAAGGEMLVATPRSGGRGGGIMLAPPPLPTAGGSVAGRPVERVRSVESHRGGFSAVVSPGK